MILRKIKTTILLLLVAAKAIGQSNPQSSVCIENDRLVFTYNLMWTDNQKDKFRELFDIDSLTLANALKGVPEFTVDGITWKSRKISSTIIEFSKYLNDGIAEQPNTGILPTSNSSNKTIYLFANYGVNKFSQPDFYFRYKNGIAQFFLPNYTNASKVCISGTFNSWSTMQTPMHKTDTGWVVSMRLNPGKYHYKFIIDGRWMRDKNNSLKEDDSQGDYNSVVYCYNYRFTLDKYTDARKAFVAGSFNGWNPNELRMAKTTKGWELPLYLREGTHAYKFIVDNAWILDPNNRINHQDGRGNVNSFVGIGPVYIFKLKGYGNAQHVFLAGNFNAWNSQELPMNRISDGWILPYNLGNGNYEYKFIVDGQWITDPDNESTAGSNNRTNSVISVNPNHTFKLKGFANAKSVIVTGSFNGWNRDGYRMVKTPSGWTLPLYLNPGKHTYKFIVDGEWIIDPDNKLWENNEHNTGNSVLWIDN